MGREFYDEFTVFRQTIEEASDTLGLNLKTLLFEGPENELLLTENAQPAILSVSTGCFRVAEAELGLTPSVLLGHSLGEYSALVAGEALPFADAVAWVRIRGQAMQEAVPVGQGTMSAILGAEDGTLVEWCREASATARENSGNPSATVECANFNAPGQVVVSGSIEAVEALERLIAGKGIRGVMAKRLSVSAPFHCSLMKPARERLSLEFKKARESGLPAKPTIPYIPNRTATAHSEPGVIFDLLEEQVDHAVLWSASVRNLIASGTTIAYEFGPGKVLQGLAKRIAKAAEKPFETLPVYDLETLKAAAKGGRT
jgi:[acyl-carrier-protein] S-malonyltransferase